MGHHPLLPEPLMHSITLVVLSRKAVGFKNASIPTISSSLAVKGKPCALSSAHSDRPFEHLSRRKWHVQAATWFQVSFSRHEITINTFETSA